MPDAQVFALALRTLDGVGRVTAGRIVEHFPTYARLRAFPREQVLLRLKGAPNAAALVATLFDEATMGPRLEAARAERAALQERGVNLRTPADPDWPSALNRLPRAQRPLLLYLYGNAQLLKRPGTYLLGAHGLAPPAFERAQEVARYITSHGGLLWCGLDDGFDVALIKPVALAPAPCVMVAPCGLANVAPPLRPVAAQAIKAGGLLLSPFDMEHGPFEHDLRERARVATAIARTVVVCAGGAGARAAAEVARHQEFPLFTVDAALSEAMDVPILRSLADLPG